MQNPAAATSPDAGPAAFQAWLNRSETTTDDVPPFPLRAMASTLGREWPDTVPPLWHWLYFLSAAPLAKVGTDGHPRRGGFLPPVELPRRMWAGGRLTFAAPLPVGKPASRRSEITHIEEKTGRSGRLVFVTVRHRIESAGLLCIEEEQDLVYRDAPQAGGSAPAAAEAPAGEAWSRTVEPDPVLLFRYSALTFNGHRIHYDYPYATREEGYAGLVVHGPLVATLLADLVSRKRPDSALATFAFRALRPAYAGRALTLCGKPSLDGRAADLWAKDHEGRLTMRAAATFT